MIFLCSCLPTPVCGNGFMCEFSLSQCIKKSSLILTIIDVVCKRFRFNLVCVYIVGTFRNRSYLIRKVSIGIKMAIRKCSILIDRFHSHCKTITISRSRIHCTQTFSINSKQFLLLLLLNSVSDFFLWLSFQFLCFYPLFIPHSFAFNFVC